MSRRLRFVPIIFVNGTHESGGESESYEYVQRSFHCFLFVVNTFFVHYIIYSENVVNFFFLSSDDSKDFALVEARADNFTLQSLR